MTRRTLSVIILALSLTPLARADLIELSDGRKLSGTLSRSGETVIIRTDDGKVVTAKPNEIAKVTLTSTVTPDEAATSEWTRIAPQVKSSDDIQAVIRLYADFLAKFPAARQAGDAQAALASFQKIAQNNPVKFRGRWLPRTQVDVLIKQWTDAARPALALYKSGRMKEAIDALKQPLADDPQNPDALALAGLAAYRSGTIPQARTYFMALAAADPTSLLAENNLGVISAQQKQNGEALAHYAKALQINPENRQVLDNTAEAINTYLVAGGDKAGLSYRTLVKQFDPAETRMEQQLGKSGLQRYGGTWVTRDQAAALTRYQDALKDRLNQIDSQYRTARDTLAALEAQIRQADVDYESFLNMYNNFNNLLNSNHVPALDNAYNIAQRDIALQNMDRVQRQKATLIIQRDQYIAGSREFFAQADKLRSIFGATSGNLALYSGVQRILDLGEDQTPPPPAALPEPPPLPTIQPPPTVIISPQTPPPVVVPVPVGGPILVPVR